LLNLVIFLISRKLYNLFVLRLKLNTIVEIEIRHITRWEPFIGNSMIFGKRQLGVVSNMMAGIFIFPSIGVLFIT
jgi:hypothetical protein